VGWSWAPCCPGMTGGDWNEKYGKFMKVAWRSVSWVAGFSVL
jgi:hypothetical protein